jgi:hypothetical protein
MRTASTKLSLENGDGKIYAKVIFESTKQTRRER